MKVPGKKWIIATLCFACFWITLESALQSSGNQAQSDFGETAKLRTPSHTGWKLRLFFLCKFI